MATNTASHITHSGYSEKNRFAPHAATEWKKQRNAIISALRIRKWFGMLSTVLIGVGVFAPYVFGIPADMQPWVFVTFIFWFFAFCAGIFDL